MPMLPPAPPRFSTTTCWPRPSDIFWASGRPMVSLPPPGGYGSTRRIGLTGYCCANTVAVPNAENAVKALAVNQRPTLKTRMQPPFTNCAILSAQAGQKISEVENLLVADFVQNVGHRGIIAAARVVLECPHGFHEVVLALAGEAGNVALAGIISLVAEIAAVALGERAPCFHAA